MFHMLTIASLIRDTPESVCLGLQIPEKSRALFDFTPGQYLTLQTDIDGVPVQRPYSICSTPSDSLLWVGIKRVHEGVFSEFAHKSLHIGDSIAALPPTGRFIAPEPDSEGHRFYVGLAAGAGITPILSILTNILSSEQQARAALFYGNRDRQSVMFRTNLEEMKDTYLDRFSVAHLLSRESQDVELLQGRLDGERVTCLIAAGLIKPQLVEGFFLCGPGDMIISSTAALSAAGVATARIHAEYFTPTNETSATQPITVRARERETEIESEEASLDSALSEVEIFLDGARRRFTTPLQTGDLIDSAARVGMVLPFSCRGGMCCTCRAKLIEGEVQMLANYSLQEWEIAAGFVLTCQARALTRRIVLDFDDV